MEDPDHSYTYAPVVTEPTCANMGYTTYTCACGDSYVGNYTDPAGHSYTAETVAPTCVSDGYTLYTCHCGHQYLSDPVAATGHSFTSVVTQPTHDRMGYTTHSCHCGYSYVDGYTDALGHDYSQAVTREPTCTEEGVMTFHCDCGASYTERIPSLDHSYTATVTELICAEMGYTSYICGCGHSYTGDYVDAAGHTLEEIGDRDGADQSAGRPYYSGQCLERGQVLPRLIAPESDFRDVPEDAWYQEAIDYMTHMGLMEGMGDGTFAPNMPGTRAMMVTILYRLAGEPAVEGLENPFTDVKKGDWYYEAVLWGAAQGVVRGISDTLFAPSRSITREQFVTMLYRCAGEPETDTGCIDSFPDGAEVSGYAREAMAWVLNMGILTGTKVDEQILLDPRNTATRAQIAVIFMRYLEN